MINKSSLGVQIRSLLFQSSTQDDKKKKKTKQFDLFFTVPKNVLRSHDIIHKVPSIFNFFPPNPRVCRFIRLLNTHTHTHLYIATMDIYGYCGPDIITRQRIIMVHKLMKINNVNSY